jgi:hypothetical protein
VKPQVIDLDANRRPREVKTMDPDDIPASAQVIAIDPGGTTGWCIISCDPESLLPGGPSVLKSVRKWNIGQVDCGSTRGNLGNSPYAGISTAGESAGSAVIARLIRNWPGAAIVVESFELRKFSKDQDLLSPQRITAKIEQYLWLDGKNYFTQTASEGKSSATDERLKDWGFYTSEGGMVHARDATRHALTFLRRASQPGRKAAELRQAAWPWFYEMGGQFNGQLRAERPA